MISSCDGDGPSTVLNAEVSQGTDALSIALKQGDEAVALDLISSAAYRTSLSDSHLVSAAESQLIAAGHMLLQKNVSAHVTRPDGQPLFLWCIQNDRPAFAHMLADATPAVLGRGLNGESPLGVAIEKRRPALVKRLIAAGANPNYHAPGNPSPLSRAISRRDVRLAIALIEAGATPTGTDPTGSPFIVSAVQQEDPQLLNALISAGADVEARDSARFNALHIAVESRNDELIKALLQAGADPNSLSPSGHTLLADSLAMRDFSLSSLFLNFGADPSSHLYGALSRQDSAAARLLLDYGARVATATFPAPEAPLAQSVRAGNRELSKRFLSRGGHIRSSPVEGQTLLALSVARGNAELVQLLIDHGADPNVRLTRPVSKAFRSHPVAEKFDWFLRKDSRITLLMMASNSAEIPLAKVLLENGARTNVKSGTVGFWPLNFASRRADVAMMRLILGANPNREERKIVVDLSEQKVRMYDSSGAVIFTTRCSSGKRGNDTPTGTFAITNKYTDWTSTLYHSKMPYFQRLSCSDFGFHVGHVPNYPASHGCIRLPAAKAKKLFKMTRRGDRVIIQR